MTEDELAAVAVALRVIPSVASNASVVEGPAQSPWLDAARREAVGLD